MDSPGKRSVLGQVISYFKSSIDIPEKDNLTNENKESMSCNAITPESFYLNKKAQTLQSAHKMNEQQRGWFEQVEGLPGANQEYVQTQPYLNKQTSQLAFNINKNCYEELPVHHTHYNPYCPHLYQFNEHEIEEETLALAPSFQPLGNLYQNIMDFMETTIVQYVCQRSHPSPYRQAAETLARSKLNPNAKEFTPMVETMAVVESKDKLRDNNYSEPVEQPLFDQGKANLGDAWMEEETDTNSSEKPEIVDCSKLVQYDASDNSNCDKNILCGYDSDVSDADDWDDEDDSDWDSDEQSTGQCVVIDPSEFEDLFPSPLLMTNLTVCAPKSSNCTSVCPAREIPQIIRTISNIDCDFNSTLPSSCRKKGKIVKFSDDVSVIEEPEDLANDLQDARISDFPARQADRERQERLLAPILTEKHRRKMYQKIYGEC